MKPWLMDALSAAPLDLAELWSCAVCFGVYSLADKRDASVGLLLDVIAQPLPGGKPTVIFLCTCFACLCTT